MKRGYGALRGAFAAAACACAAQGQLLQPSDLEYRGAFRLPDWPDPQYGWEWGGSALAYCPGGDPGGGGDGYPGSLFGTGNDQTQHVCEVGIPEPVISAGKNAGELNTAPMLQGFRDVRGGLYPFGSWEIPRAGLECLPAQGAQASGKLYFCWGQHMQEGATDPTHGWCELDLADPRPAGAWRIGEYWNYVTCDYMFSIPQYWADACVPGMRLATGRCRDGGQGAMGPSLIAIGPWNSGNPPASGTTLAAVPLLLYGNAYEGEPAAMAGYHFSDDFPAAAWLTAGSKSAVVFAGTKGTGECWYGCQDGTSEPPWPPDCARGWWSSGFEGRIIFYNTDELAAVAAGMAAPSAPQPYASMNIDGVLYHVASPQQWNHVSAAAFDRERGHLFVSEQFGDGDKPLVHVWKVLSDGGEPTPAPARTPTRTPTAAPAGDCACGPLPPPGGGEAVVTASSVAAIQAAIDGAEGPTTVYIASGTYAVSGYGIQVTAPDITLRSASGNRDDVVIRGEGMGAGGLGFGITVWEGGTTVADLTVEQVQNHGIFIQPEFNPSGFLFHNIRVADCGEQLFKASGGAGTGTKNDGIIECSTFEYATALDEGNYTNGIDLLNSRRWTVRDNVLRNIKAASGAGLAGPAILVWQGSADTVVERNRVIDCDMGIAFGNSGGTAPDHSGGVIRNNFVRGHADSDFGICVSQSPGATVVNNTVWSPGGWPYSVEVQFSTAVNCLLQNNLADEPFLVNRFGDNNPTLVTNRTDAESGWFEGIGEGDLHLAPGAAAVDAGTAAAVRVSDIDCGPIVGGLPDIGADEFGSPGSFPSPTPTPSPAGTATATPGGPASTPTATPVSGAATVVFQDGVSPDASYAGTADAIVAGDYPSSNLGGLGNLECFYEPGAEMRRSLLRWDIAALPAGAAVEGARVELYHYAEEGGAEREMEIALHLVARPWTEGTGETFGGGGADGATWDAASPGTNWTSPGGDLDTATDFGRGPNGIVDAATLPAGAWEGWVVMDATAAVRAWVEEGRGNNGLAVRPLGGDYTFNYFRSSEHGTASRRPRLVIECAAGGASFPARVNFQPEGRSAPPGHLRDDGSAFAARGSWVYGWR